MKSCDVCGEPMLADELGLRHAGCRAEYERQRGRRRRTEARELDWHHPARVVTAIRAPRRRRRDPGAVPHRLERRTARNRRNRRRGALIATTTGAEARCTALGMLGFAALRRAVAYRG